MLPVEVVSEAICEIKPVYWLRRSCDEAESDSKTKKGSPASWSSGSTLCMLVYIVCFILSSVLRLGQKEIYKD